MQINIVEYLEKTVLRCPEKPAVIDGDRAINFRELVLRSKTLGAKIIGQLNCINQPVAVFMEKSIESVVANTAITYSGNIYMNLDVKNPDIRLQNICNKIKPVLIITNNTHAKKLNEILTGIIHQPTFGEQMKN